MTQNTPESKTGIVAWGGYVPVFRIKLSEIVKMWGMQESLPAILSVEEKSVDNVDEDALTMGFEAARIAIERGKVNPSQIGAVFFGTESKPYAVKPSATVIAEALGITPTTMASDLEFACRAASEALRASIGLVSSGMLRYSLVIGSDTAQANPGDVLELTASSGAAAFIVGRKEESAAYFEASYSYVTDTPDFWRRALSPYPLHGEGFTGEPAYFAHIVGAVRGLMETTGLKPSDFDYAVFHQPNGRFPIKVAQKLGIPKEKVLPGLVTPKIGNTYNASALLGLVKILDQAKSGERILLAPFGSGAGSDAYSIIVTDLVEERKRVGPTLSYFIDNKVYVPYATYAKNRGLIRRIDGWSL